MPFWSPSCELTHSLTHSLWEVNRPATALDQAAILCHPRIGSHLPLYSPLHSAARSCHSSDLHFTKNKVCPDVTTCESLSPHLPLPSHTGLCSSDTLYWACFGTCIYALHSIYLLGCIYCPLPMEWSPQVICGAYSSHSGSTQMFSSSKDFSDHPLENSIFQSPLS